MGKSLTRLTLMRGTADPSTALRFGRDDEGFDIRRRYPGTSRDDDPMVEQDERPALRASDVIYTYLVLSAFVRIRLPWPYCEIECTEARVPASAGSVE